MSLESGSPYLRTCAIEVTSVSIGKRTRAVRFVRPRAPIYRPCHKRGRHGLYQYSLQSIKINKTCLALATIEFLYIQGEVT